jgi:hypothetical protein
VVLFLSESDYHGEITQRLGRAFSGGISKRILFAIANVFKRRIPYQKNLSRYE